MAHVCSKPVRQLRYQNYIYRYILSTWSCDKDTSTKKKCVVSLDHAESDLAFGAMLRAPWAPVRGVSIHSQTHDVSGCCAESLSPFCSVPSCCSLKV